MTHVAFVCDRADVQRVLPQVFIVSEQTVPAAALAALRAAAPGNVHILRQRSAWNNRYVRAWIVGLLSAAIEPFAAEVQPLLMLDAVRLHTAAMVLSR